MKLAFCIIGSLGIMFGTGLLIATLSAKLDPLEGYSAGSFVVLAGVAHLFAAAKNYRGHWSFVVGIALLAFGLSALGGIGYSTASAGQIAFGISTALAIVAFGALSLWSGHKLHRCTVHLERMTAGLTVLEGGQAICVECGGIFKTQDMIKHDIWHVCARCKPSFLQRLSEGGGAASPAAPSNR